VEGYAIRSMQDSDRQGTRIIIGAVDTSGDGVAERSRILFRDTGGDRVGYARQYSVGRTLLCTNTLSVGGSRMAISMARVRPWLLTKSLCGSSTAVVCPSRPRPKRCQRLNGSFALFRFGDQHGVSGVYFRSQWFRSSPGTELST
jgi:hypothetical protein